MKKYLSALFILCLSVGLVSLAMLRDSNADGLAARIDIKAISGQVSVSSDGSVFQPVRAGDFAGPGSVIQTGPASTADLILPDSGTVLRMLPDTTLKFSRLTKQPAGEQVVSETALKLLHGSVIGAQRKLAVPSRFDIATAQNVATIVGTEYVINAAGAVTVLEGAVSINYNLPGNKGSIKVTIAQGYTFDPASGTIVPTSAQYLQNIIADVNTVKQNAQTFKAAGATIVVKPESFISPTKGNNGVGNGVDPQPPGNPPVNDGPGTSPGNPGNQGGAKK